jgi:hypothetical protein
MKCAELENTLALCSAGENTPVEESNVLAAHLTACPLCRQKKEDYAEIRGELRRLKTPELPASVRTNLKVALRTELRRSDPAAVRVSRDFSDWLQMRVMPYGVGVAVTLVVGIGMLTAMLSGSLGRPDAPAVARANEPAVYLATNARGSRGDSSDLTASDVANSRMQFAQESPSINPNGALVALTKSLVRGEMKDEEVVVVADVFSNGLAKISEVVESPKDKKIVDELEKALNDDPRYAPFVPTVIEDRPEYMQIVLKIQNVSVPTGLRPVRRRS